MAGRSFCAWRTQISTLTRSLRAKGVIFTDLQDAAQNRTRRSCERILGQTVNVEEGKFAAMAGAFARNGLLLYVPKDVQLEQPLHSVLWGPGASLRTFLSLACLRGRGRLVTYVHEVCFAHGGARCVPRRHGRDQGIERRQPEVRRAAVLGQERLELQP